MRLARLSFKTHSCKTLWLCYLEPNQHAYISKELLHENTSHGYVLDWKHFIWCVNTHFPTRRKMDSISALRELIKE